MAARRSSKVLNEVVNIRLVQRRAAEAHVAAAAQALSVLKDEHTDALARLNEADVRWSRAMSAQSVPLYMMSALGEAVLEKEQALVRVNADIFQAKQEKSQADDLWRGSLANERAAQSLAKSARRFELRVRDEEALKEAADRTSRQERP